MDMVPIDEASAGRTIDIGVGEVIELRLKENPTTGFRWQVSQDPGPACRIAEDHAEPVPAGPPGQGTTHVWRIEAVQPGVCDLALTYGRQWEASAPANRFDVHIAVK
jgi:inhibitor of cysteine peptidase